MDVIEKKVHKKKIKPYDMEDVRFWLDRTPEERLSALEAMRCDYWGKDYADKSGFPRVYKVVKHPSR
jgi:hypothetical protein